MRPGEEGSSASWKNQSDLAQKINIWKFLRCFYCGYSMSETLISLLETSGNLATTPFSLENDTK